VSPTPTISDEALRRIRRGRRHPRITQFDYLHVRALVADLAEALRGAASPGADVLDVYCGSRPYDDLLPPGSNVVGLDVVGNHYGVADVESDEFLPFADASFDLVLCTQAFDLAPDPVAAIAEIRRVLRPGGAVVITVAHVWEYDRTQLVHRYTGPELAHLFAGWRDVEVRESGGRGVAWATLTGSLLHKVEARLARSRAARRVVPGLFAVAYVGVNLVGSVLEAVEQRSADGEVRLPMNLLLTARRAD